MVSNFAELDVTAGDEVNEHLGEVGRPVTDRDVHVPGMDEIEMGRWKGPGLFEVVNLEGYVGIGPGGLDGCGVDADDFGRGVLGANVEGPDA